ncbi:FCD domain protein [compost metagenome]
MTLYTRAPNRRLLKLVEDGLNEEERFLRFNLEAMGLGKLSQDDHKALLQAAEARDVEHSVQLLEHHLNRAVEVITRYLNSPEVQARNRSK